MKTRFIFAFLLLFGCQSNTRTETAEANDTSEIKTDTIAAPEVAQGDGQGLGSSANDFVDHGWVVKKKAEGDLNKDGVPDLVMVIENASANAEGAHVRSILVLFKDDLEYNLVCRGDSAIMNDQEGGMMGDPFQELNINEKGVIILEFSGGAREKWFVSYKYRYQNGDFELIGATQTGYDSMTSSEYEYDYNLNTGNMIISVKDEENPKKSKKETRTEKLPKLPLLKSFKPWSLSFSGGVSF